MENENRVVVGVDIGGTKVAAGLVDAPEKSWREAGPL